MKNTTNVFLKGMTTDMHPLTTSQLEYTDALNATLITFNGNEQMMQNDMGNTRIQDSKTGNIMGLREGFIPVGMKEHGGIMYIASVNNKGEGEIGTIPCPVIEYKSQENVEKHNLLNFDWAADNDESEVFEIYDDEINPEEIFIIDIDNPIINGNKIISSLDPAERHLYIPHLIAVTPKSEKDITPTAALTNSKNKYWFQTTHEVPDLQVLNQPVELPSGELLTVNFLSYPKIQSGKLGIKFTKEGIESFDLAPNGKNNKNYPVLQYTEDESGRTYYSVLYGVQYITESDVKIDRIKISCIVDGNKRVEKKYIVEGSELVDDSDDSDDDDDILRDFNILEVTRQYRHKHFLTKLNGINTWPASDTTFEDTEILNRISRKDQSPHHDVESIHEPEPVDPGDYLVLRRIRSVATENTEIPCLYAITLGSDFNKWIDLRIEYYYKALWNKPIGVYTMTYNPYYMDVLNQFVIDKYYQYHTFRNGMLSFPQYREYSSTNQSDSVEIQYIGDAADTIGDLDAINDPKSYSFLYKKFSDDESTLTVLDNTSDLNNRNFVWSFDSNLTIPAASNKMTTYLRLNISLDNLNPGGIFKINNITIPIGIYENTKYKQLNSTIGAGVEHNSGEIKISYNLDINDIRIETSEQDNIITAPSFTPIISGSVDEEDKSKYFYVGDVPYSAGWSGHIGSNINLNQEYVGNVHIDWSDKIYYDFGGTPVEFAEPQMDITIKLSNLVIKTKKLMHYSTHQVHDIYIVLGTPTINVTLGSFSYSLTVPYLSDCAVYPQVDAVIEIDKGDHNIVAVPACISGTSWNPICINYTKNYMSFNTPIPTAGIGSINTGYTGKRTVSVPSEQSSASLDVQSSFNLQGLELYYRYYTIDYLKKDKYYIFYNNSGFPLKLKSVFNNITSDTADVNSPILIHCTNDISDLSLVYEGAASTVGFRSMGIYEITGEITDFSSDSIFTTITSNSGIKVNDINIWNCIWQTVYCYAERTPQIQKTSDPLTFDRRDSYYDCTYARTGTALDSTKYIKEFYCVPVPEYGYQKSNLAFEYNTKEEYWDSDHNSLELLDKSKEIIKFRSTPTYNSVISFPDLHQYHHPDYYNNPA